MSENAITRVDVLYRAAEISKGSTDLAPRPGQVQLFSDLLDAASARTSLAGIAPTGTGKSFAYLSASALAAYERRERTVISTDGKSLQAQLIDVDLPTMRSTMRELFDFELSFAVFKGVQEYCDPLRAIDLAQSMLDDYTDFDYGRLAAGIEAARSVGALCDPRLWRTHGAPRPGGERESPSTDLDLDALADLALWALKMYTSDGEVTVGDRQSCPLGVNDSDWKLVSSDADGRFRRTQGIEGFSSKYERARDRARRAHIVVTNHKLLAMQTVTGTSIVMGRPESEDPTHEGLGIFQRLIVDEAHSFPAIVRDESTTRLHGNGIRRLWKLVQLAGSAPDQKLQATLNDLALRLDEALIAHAELLDAKPTRFDPVPMVVLPADDPGPLVTPRVEMLALFTDLFSWAGSRPLANGQKTSEVRRLEKALMKLMSAVRTAGSTGPEAIRWITVEQDDQGTKTPSLRRSEVDIRPLVQRMTERTKLHTSAWLSATLPEDFCRVLGLRDEIRHYATPFGEAYARSAVFIPAVSSADVGLFLGSDGKFSIRKHEDWAAEAILRMVRANGGSALVLSATTAGAKRYAAELREAFGGEIEVVSHLDGGSHPEKIARWKASERSVLVGTKGFMTGVDAPGVTNTLVILDRLPRSRSNPVDDGRVRSHQAAFPGTGVWDARSAVYVEDAAVLVEQAMGRLIRSTTDSGMAVLLDPRVGALRQGLQGLPVGAEVHCTHLVWPQGGVPEKVGRMLLNNRDVLRYTPWIESFSTRVGTLDEAVSWLEAARV